MDKAPTALSIELLTSVLVSIMLVIAGISAASGASAIGASSHEAGIHGGTADAERHADDASLCPHRSGLGNECCSAVHCLWQGLLTNDAGPLALVAEGQSKGYGSAELVFSALDRLERPPKFDPFI